jgi:hypothetical protein
MCGIYFPIFIDICPFFIIITQVRRQPHQSFPQATFSPQSSCRYGMGMLKAAKNFDNEKS